jgi:8-oxo-dGTP diphosphatase
MREVPEVKFAAGGIVWDKKGEGRRLALVHRGKYDDWSLPKGKVDPGEEIGATALREVQEELGVDADFGPFAGTTHYPLADGRTKGGSLLAHDQTGRGKHIQAEQGDRRDRVA